MQDGPMRGDAAKGMDRPYVADKPRADKELDATQAGNTPRPAVPRDDTAMKNPDGDLNDPAAYPRQPR